MEQLFIIIVDLDRPLEKYTHMQTANTHNQKRNQQKTTQTVHEIQLLNPILMSSTKGLIIIICVLSDVQNMRIDMLPGLDIVP